LAFSTKARRIKGFFAHIIYHTASAMKKYAKFAVCLTKNVALHLPCEHFFIKKDKYEQKS
jgi:hypothetical protein